MRPFSRITVRSSTNRLSEHTPMEEVRDERAVGWMLWGAEQGRREVGTCQGQHVGEGHSAVPLELVRRSSQDDVIAAWRRRDCMEWKWRWSEHTIVEVGDVLCVGTSSIEHAHY